MKTFTLVQDSEHREHKVEFNVMYRHVYVHHEIYDKVCKASVNSGSCAEKMRKPKARELWKKFVNYGYTRLEN
jgi:hypothetical protein